MKRFTQTFVAALAALPLIAAAQTANTPGGSASTGTPLDQTTTAPQKATPKSTRTTPNTTNPSGDLSKGAAPMSGDTSSDTSTMGKSKKRSKGASATPPVGDVPTYPAPAKDGTPTK